MTDAVTAPSGKTCPSCGTAAPLEARECPSCHASFEADPAPPVTPVAEAPAAQPEAPTAQKVEDLAPEETLAGQWKLESKIGAGGMGNVFLATDLKLGRKVAVKALSTENLQEETVKRFEREAQVMGKLDHPNVVTLYAVGRHRDIPFLVMRYLEGGSLWDLLDANGGRLLPEQLLPLVKQLCSALGYIHGKNLIHRDLKPSNIFISPQGKVTVLDLGLARGHNTTLTKTGIIWGTPDFMAPEQIVGEKQLDGRADLYALGVVLYRVISNQPPFSETEEQSLMRAHLSKPRPDISKVWPGASPALGAMLQKAMAIRPEERFQTAEELITAFERVVTTKDQPTRASSPAPVQMAAPAAEVAEDDKDDSTVVGFLPPSEAAAGPTIPVPPSAAVESVPAPSPTPPSPPPQMDEPQLLTEPVPAHRPSRPAALPLQSGGVPAARPSRPAPPVPSASPTPPAPPPHLISQVTPAARATPPAPPVVTSPERPGPPVLTPVELDDDRDDRTHIGDLPGVASSTKPDEALSNPFDDADDHTHIGDLPPGVVTAAPAGSAYDIAEGEDDKTNIGELPAAVKPNDLLQGVRAKVPTVMDRPAGRADVITDPESAGVDTGTLDGDEAVELGGDYDDEPKTEMAQSPLLNPDSTRVVSRGDFAAAPSAPRPRKTSPPARVQPDPNSATGEIEPEAESPAWMHPYVLAVGGLLLLALGFLIGVLLR